MEVIRINKFLSSAGVCSRRKADALIEEKRVTVNGRIAVTGETVTTSDEVCVDGKRVVMNNEKVVIAYNKPVGIVCSLADQGKDHNNIIDAIGYPIRIYPVGRLDKDSEGLILLTNDGDLADHIMRAGDSHEKEYEVTVDKAVSDGDLRSLEDGIEIELEYGPYRTKPCRVYRIGNDSFGIVLTEGKNRQIRRMCEALGYAVKRLKRTRIMHIHLDDLKTGRYRELSGEEIARF